MKGVIVVQGVSSDKDDFHVQMGQKTSSIPAHRELPAELVCFTQESVHNVASQTVDHLDVAPVLWTEMHDFFGLESTVIEQVDQSLLTPIGQHRLESLPHLAVVGLIYSVGFSWISRLR